MSTAVPWQEEHRGTFQQNTEFRNFLTWPIAVENCYVKNL